MNLSQLKYILEIEKTNSITWAADNLYMEQPNLSRSVRELEGRLGFEIFSRTSKGMIPTPEGKEVLIRAKAIMEQVEAISAIGKNLSGTESFFGLSAPPLTYIVNAYAAFAAELDTSQNIQLGFRRSGGMEAMENVCEFRHNLGIIRYYFHNDDLVLEQLKIRGLEFKELPIGEIHTKNGENLDITDILVWREGYKFSELDNLFIEKMLMELDR